MTPVLAALLLFATPAQGAASEPPPKDATAPGTTTVPQAARQAPGILGQDIRLEAYQMFRDLYESSRFEEALPYAKQVLALSEHGEDPDYELPIAYNNLGATQFQLGDYEAATDSYRKSLDLLEATQGISSRRLVVPLAGLGASYAAQNQHQVAAEMYERALAVSRRADGLFNLQQVPLIRQAADSRMATSDYAGAERDHLYALRVAEQNYGYGDPRTIPTLLDFAVFYESMREFIAARVMYLRVRDAALAANPGFSADAVTALMGVSRSHRMQLALAPETLERPRDDFGSDVSGRTFAEPRLLSPAADRTGLKAAQQALDLMRLTPEPPAAQMSLVLIELGDWHQTLSRPAQSMPYYTEAAAILDARSVADPLAANPLREPRMVFYRPPAGSARKAGMPPGAYLARKTVFSFLVDESGQPVDITTLPGEMNDTQLMLTRRALSKAIYSPRFAEGKPIATAGVTFTGEWYELAPEDPPPDAPAEGRTQPPEAAAKPAEPASGPGA